MSVARYLTIRRNLAGHSLASFSRQDCFCFGLSPGGATDQKQSWPSRFLPHASSQVLSGSWLRHLISFLIGTHPKVPWPSHLPVAPGFKLWFHTRHACVCVCVCLLCFPFECMCLFWGLCLCLGVMWGWGHLRVFLYFLRGLNGMFSHICTGRAHSTQLTKMLVTAVAQFLTCGWQM